MSGNFVSDGIFRRYVVFTPAHTDENGAVRPDAVAYEMQEIASEHYEALGLGREVSDAHGVFWALTRSEMHFLASLPVGERLALDTWSGRHAYGLFWRHYRLTREDGTVLFRAVSVWVLMDMRTRAMVKDVEWITERGGVKQPEELPTSLRRPAIPAELPEKTRRVVTAGETDVNGHLNNTRYLRWGTELAGGDFAASHRLRALWIEYKKELPLGASAEIAYRLGENELLLRGTCEEKESFAMRCEYDPI